MNIWIVKDTEPISPKEKLHRPFRYTSLMLSLIESGNDVRFFTSNFDHFNKRFKAKNELDFKTNKKPHQSITLIETVAYSKNVSFRRFINQILLARNFNRMSEQFQKPDLILCSIPSIELAYEVSLYAFKYKIPLIIDVVDLWPDLFKSVLPTWKFIFIYPYIYSLRGKLSNIMDKANSIVAITEEYLKWGLRYSSKPHDKMTAVFHLGHLKVDLLSINNNFRVIFIGSITRQFNFDLLFSAARLLTNINFDILGSGDMLEYYVKMTSRIPNIHWLGWKDTKEKEILLQRQKLNDFTPSTTEKTQRMSTVSSLTTPVFTII
jgi:glycosyltransferase involved in cell wall biosynthesis